MKPTVLIAADYWSPKKALQYGYPWLVPEAIVRLVEILTKEMTVLEFGAGGSTLFFAKLVKCVTSYETSQVYVNLMKVRLAEEDITNVSINFFTPDNLPIISDIYDVVLLDAAPFGIRPLLLPNLWSLCRKYFIIDNYVQLKITHSNIPKGWLMETYNDYHWIGRGTAILVNYGNL